MKTRSIVGATLLATAGLCALNASAQPADRVVQVTVANGRIVVAEREVRVQKSQGALLWRLPDGDFSFPANGIVITAPTGVFMPCTPIANGRQFRCVIANRVTGARYKYDVNVNAGGTALPTLDPFINLE